MQTQRRCAHNMSANLSKIVDTLHLKVFWRYTIPLKAVHFIHGKHSPHSLEIPHHEDAVSKITNFSPTYTNKYHS